MLERPEAVGEEVPEDEHAGRDELGEVRGDLTIVDGMQDAVFSSGTEIRRMISRSRPRPTRLTSRNCVNWVWTAFAWASLKVQRLFQK